MRLIIRTLSLLAAVMLIAASLSYYDLVNEYKVFLTASTESTADITSVTRTDNGYVLQFSYTADGKNIEGVYRTHNKDLATGSTLHIYYSNTDPEKIMLKRNYEQLLDVDDLKIYRNLTILVIVGFCVLLILYGPIYGYLLSKGKLAKATVVDMNTVKLDSGHLLTNFTVNTRKKPGSVIGVIVKKDYSEFILFSKAERVISFLVFLFLIGLLVYLARGGFLI